MRHRVFAVVLVLPLMACGGGDSSTTTPPGGDSSTSGDASSDTSSGSDSTSGGDGSSDSATPTDSGTGGPDVGADATTCGAGSSCFPYVCKCGRCTSSDIVCINTKRECPLDCATDCPEFATTKCACSDGVCRKVPG